MLIYIYNIYVYMAGRRKRGLEKKKVQTSLSISEKKNRTNVL